MPSDPQHLRKLIDDFRIQELLSLVTLEEIAEAWCRYHARDQRSGVERDDPDWWAVGLLMFPEIRSDEQRLRALLELLVERAPNEDVLAAAAAGPLEDFLAAAEGRLYWVQQCAEKSPRFREALQRVWVRDPSPDALPHLESDVVVEAEDDTIAEEFAVDPIEVAADGEPETVEIEHGDLDTDVFAKVVAAEPPETVEVERNGSDAEPADVEPIEVVPGELPDVVEVAHHDADVEQLAVEPEEFQLLVEGLRRNGQDQEQSE